MAGGGTYICVNICNTYKNILVYINRLYMSVYLHNTYKTGKSSQSGRMLLTNGAKAKVCSAPNEKV
jgi:hypothetical protein